ncbi:uncharacterized protein LOC126910292 [Daktulosphaira vitifoliae]|uniref:uncharacterized protein LOC126910292 n=1 Tax=Daktulosphaira vitifoliae TaxID=58002 RepID=UPI0021AB059D|nr:uncharacterized protein LOC126910292 [Daktulosphaira vitifoliae]
MYSLRFYKYSFLLFYAILGIKADIDLKKTIHRLDELLKYSGWKKLNDLYHIIYFKKQSYLKDLIETPTSSNQYDAKIRALTIYLGCTYAKVTNNVLSVISNFIENYSQFKEDNDLINVYIFTERLLNIITTFIVPMATLMKGAMDALDLLHHRPWISNARTRYMISPSLGYIGNILDELNRVVLSRVDISTCDRTLNSIVLIFKRIINYVENETVDYCNFIPYNRNYLWHEWVQEYKTIIFQGKQLFFLKFFNRKIKDYIKIVIIEKYFQLGFKFDPITEETFITAPNELIELELEFKVTDQESPTLIQIDTFYI